ncbi:MAG: helix-turn-helix domain-containing protein [Patescibacteria group bacterium]
MKIDKFVHIEQFLREKVEYEGFTDAQIASLLDVGVSTVCHWRNKFNIKPADKFPGHFKEKYGPDAIDFFHAMVRNGGMLMEIAGYFGFSREYARRVFVKLYGMSFTEYHGRRRIPARNA